MPLTNVTDQHVVTRLLGKVAWTPPATVYVGLSTTAPSQVKGATASHYWTVTEPSGGSYARVAVTNNTTKWVEVTSPPTDGYEVTNHTPITFPAPTGSWGTPGYFTIWSAATGGTLLAFGTLTVAKPIGSGDTAPTFPAKSLTCKNN